jgi:hypothetical protein
MYKFIIILSSIFIFIAIAFVIMLDVNISIGHPIERSVETQSQSAEIASNSSFTTISFLSHLTGQVQILNEVGAKDVTYQDVITFLAFDETDKIKYNSNFSCADYSQILQNNSERKGINCGWVYVDLIGSDENDFTDHSCNVFNTTDRGIIFVDVTGSDDRMSHPLNMDKMVKLKKGDKYSPVSIFYEKGWTGKWTDSGIVSDYKIYW